MLVPEKTEEENYMKKFLALLLAVLMIAGCASAMAEAVKLDKLTLEFVPSKDADVIITGTKNLPDLLKAALLEQGYDVGEIDITVGTSYEATGEAMAAGAIDIGWLPGGTYALYSDEVDVILTATRAGLSNDSTDPKTWNGDANKTLPTEEQVKFYRSLIYATPSAYGKELAAKVNAGEALTWDDLNKANWAVLKTSSSAGYIYPTMWLMANYEGKKISDLTTAVTLSGYGESVAQAAAESVDIIVAYADIRRDYEAAWNLATDKKTDKDITGLGRSDSIWNELNVIGVTDGIYNDTVSITKANPAVYNPEFIAAMQNALINVISTEEGKAIFSVYSHTGYAVATDADYEGARQALNAVQ
jgi:phosphonate transport system substrate-binding protein